MGSRQWEVGSRQSEEATREWRVRGAEVGGQNYTELIAWQKAIDLVQAVYEFSSRFPREETYCLTSQIRRAAVSIPSNIAEGEGRRSIGEFGRFLAIAHGSLREVETQVVIAERLGYAASSETEELRDLMSEVGRLINGLSRSLKRQ